MATKVQLEKEIKELREFKKEVHEGVKKILRDYCEDAREPVNDFCNYIDMDFPKTKLTLEIIVDAGDTIDNIETDNHEVYYKDNFKITKKEDI